MEALHAHTCGNCKTRWTHSGKTPGSWRSKHTCPRCRSWPWTRIERLETMRRNYRPRQRFLAACCGGGGFCMCACFEQGGCGSCAGQQSCGDPFQCQGQGQQCGGQGYGGGMPGGGQQGGNYPPPSQPRCANSVAQQNTGQSPSGTTPQWISNLTNFQTPYPYLAIGGVILVAALLIPGGRKAGSAAPTVFHYG